MPTSFAAKLFSWTEDQEFLIQAGMELLLALGVRAETVARLPELRNIEAELDALAEHYARAEPESDSVVGADEDPGVAVDPDRALAEARARYDAILEKAYRIAEPAAVETLAMLDRERIRPELVGVDRDSLHHGLSDLQSLYASGTWRGGDGETLGNHLQWIQDRHPWTVTALSPERGEVVRIVEVLRRMPKATLKRIARARQRTWLRVLILSALFSLRRDPEGFRSETGRG